MAALLAAEARPRHEHRGQDVLVADRGADQAPARGLDRVLQPTVGQDRHDQAVAVQGAARQSLEGEDAQHLVAVHEVPGPVHRDAPVRVPVEREAHVGTLIAHGDHERLGVRRAAARG